MTTARWLLACLLVIASVGAAAQPQKIYRCGPDGRQLQQNPCGTVQPAATKPAPSGADRSEAAEVAKREAELAERMQREREKRERAEGEECGDGDQRRPGAGECAEGEQETAR